MREMPLFLSIRDCARFTGLSQYAIRRGVKNGTIASIRSGSGEKNQTILVNMPRLLASLGVEEA